jgi:hypothetical protein
VNVLYYVDTVESTDGVVSLSTDYNFLADTEDGKNAITAQFQLLC